MIDLITTASKEEERVRWDRRHIDPMVMARFVAETKVIPAGEAGVGWRIYPNGVTEEFKVKR